MLPIRTEAPGAATNGRNPGGHGSPAEDSPDTKIMSPAAEAQGICLRLLTARSRTRAELADALRRRGVAEEVGEPVLDRLSEIGLMDDAAFAESAVYSGHNHRGLGRQALSAELRRRGVSDEITREAVATVRPEDEEQRARDLVRRKVRASAAQDPRSLARKLSAMLARKGYSEELAWRVVHDELGSGSRPMEVEPFPE